LYTSTKNKRFLLRVIITINGKNSNKRIKNLTKIKYVYNRNGEVKKEMQKIVVLKLD